MLANDNRLSVKQRPEELLAILLLHEAGHIHYGDWNTPLLPDPSQRSATKDSYLNVMPTVEKKRELRADLFAAQRLREAAFGKHGNISRMITAIMLSTAAWMVSWNITTKRIVDHFGAGVLGSRDVFWDQGYLHPNMEYRFLKIGYELNPTPQGKELLQAFEGKRNPIGTQHRGILVEERN